MIEEQQNQEKKNYIRAQKEQATYKVQEFIVSKLEKAKQENMKKMELEKKNIKDYESEAQ